MAKYSTQFGLSFLWTKEWDPPAQEFGALVPIYGTVVTSIIAPDHCGSGEFWYCTLFNRTGTQLAKAPIGYRY